MLESYLTNLCISNIRAWSNSAKCCRSVWLNMVAKTPTETLTGRNSNTCEKAAFNLSSSKRAVAGRSAGGVAITSENICEYKDMVNKMLNKDGK